MRDTAAGNRYVQRFSPYRIIEHWCVAVVFIVLVATGLSQKFYEFEISQWFVITLGGIDVVRLVHRINGVVFTLLIAQHVIVASYGVLFRKWRPSILISKKDLEDVIDNLKFYFGLTNRPARCDRYDYKQKFEYWGILAGGIIMIATGLTLWFPILVARFLPGAVIPAAKALHSNVATMIFLIIAIWHIYNSIFSPEVFPLDTVIFTGKIPLERMKREHPEEYERLFGVPPEEGERETLSSGDFAEGRRQESS
jgi:formate dehydrogenase subunit gamma